MATSKITKLPLAEQWATRITGATAKTVESIIETGQLLIAAKSELAHGEWLRLFDDGLVPFSIRSAQRLMVIAEHPLLSNATHVSHLPPSWGTLYQLSRVPEPVLKNALGDQVITPDWQRKDVATLLPAKAPQPVLDPPEVVGKVRASLLKRIDGIEDDSTKRMMPALLREVADELEQSLTATEE